MIKVKALHGCVICLYCTNKIAPLPIGVLTSEDMDVLQYGGCKILGGNRLVYASRKCKEYNT